MDPVLIGVAVVAVWPRSSRPACCRCSRWCWPHRRNGGRRRPLGIAIGLAVAFVFFTLTASRLLMALGLPQDLLRNLAIAMLALVGIAFWCRQWQRRWDALYQPLAAAASARLTAPSSTIGTPETYLGTTARPPTGALDDLYQLSHLAGPGSHLLRLEVQPGTALYSFTFG